MSLERVILFVLALLSMSCSSPPTDSVSAPVAPDIKVVNGEAPGARCDLKAHVVVGKRTLFEFYSDQCAPCAQMAPIMEFLAETSSDLAIRKFNIGRPGHQGIDFDSPLCEQHDISAVPYFHIYDATGRLVATGDTAKDTVREWYNAALIAKHAEADPTSRRVSEPYREEE
jgi:thiol-disulfide isomerase/thioredoxin